ncbi:hypothetical protein BDQ17DRAFT_811720 [Cyathus striatus]|nr:hypothetical protein BDQ17DRAFT_811720 [Cyathus striatus]
MEFHSVRSTWIQCVSRTFHAYTPGPAGYPASGPTSSHGPAPAGHQTAVYSQQGQQSQQQGGYPVPQGGYAGQQPNAPYGQQGPNPYPAQSQQGTQSQQQPQQPQYLVQGQPLSQAHPQYSVQGQPPQAQPQQVHQPQVESHVQSQAQLQPQVQTQPQSQSQSQPQPPSQIQPQGQTVTQGQPQLQPAETHVVPQVQSQFQLTQAQQQPALQQAQSGPPYIFNPKTTYPDPNVQAWAQYYAQGGRDLAGAVYFVNIPGLTDTSPKNPSPTEFSVQEGQGQEAIPQTITTQGMKSTDSLSSQTKPQQTQPHELQGYQPSQTAGNMGTMEHGEVTNSPTQQVPHHPVQQPLPHTSPNAGQSTPQAISSTPSWVLPKKSESKVGVDAVGSPYSSLSGQFSGMNVSDSTNSAQSSTAT